MVEAADAVTEKITGSTIARAQTAQSTRQRVFFIFMAVPPCFLSCFFNIPVSPAGVKRRLSVDFDKVISSAAFDCLPDGFFRKVVLEVDFDVVLSENNFLHRGDFL